MNVQQTQDGFVVNRVSPRWTLRYGNEELSIAHGSVARSRSGTARNVNQSGRSN